VNVSLTPQQYQKFLQWSIDPPLLGQLDNCPYPTTQ